MVVENEVIEVNKSIPCEIYAVRGGRLAGSPTPRAYVTLTFDAVQHSRLAGLLMANLKGTTTIHVLDIQAPLSDEDEEEEPVPKLTPQMALPEDDGTEEVMMIVNGEPSKVRRPRQRNGTKADGQWPLHAFVVNPDRENLCLTCNHAIDDDVHDAGKGPHAFERHALDPLGTCAICGEAEEYELHDPAKRVHVFETDTDYVYSPDEAARCSLCGASMPDPIHEGALSSQAQSLIASVDEDEEPAAIEVEGA